MPFVKSDVSVAQISPKDWKLLQPLTYKGKKEIFIIPAGFETDFASVPRIFFWLVPSYGVYTKAAILHDYLLRENIVPSADADGIFRRAMRELKVPFFRRWMMWSAVRIHSGLDGISLSDYLRFLAVFIPALALMAIPGVIIFAWLVIVWLIEVVIYILLLPISAKRVNPPRFMS
jgi:hypothetical protein